MRASKIQIFVIITTLAGARAVEADDEVRAECARILASAEKKPAFVRAPKGWLKGQLHLHSSNSGDSRTPPEDVARWYASRGYDFIVFTDHQKITSVPSSSPMLIASGVELTQNVAGCDPPPDAPGEGCFLHVNALFATALPKGPLLAPISSNKRIDLFQRAIDAAHELGALVQINHPNWKYAADAKLLTQLASRGATLVEIANEAIDSNNAGDAAHPSTEALWDAVLTSGARMYGVATDDAHHYDDAVETCRRGEPAFTGDRGFIFVRAPKIIDLEGIARAIGEGDFYSSNGVVLTKVERTENALVLEAPSIHRFQLIGEQGRVLEERKGRKTSFKLDAGRSRYVRVRVIRKDGKMAWTQPIFIASPADLSPEQLRPPRGAGDE